MDINHIIYGAFVISVGGLIAYVLRDLPKQGFEWAKRKTLYSVTIYQSDELFEILESWMYNNYKNKYSDVEATLGYVDVLPGMEQIERKLQFKQEENFFIAQIGGKKIFISKAKEKLDKAQSLRDVYYRKYIIRGFMAKEQINAMLLTIVDEYNKKKQRGSLRVYTNNSWGDWQCVNDVAVKAFDKVILPTEQKDDIISDVEEFVSSQSWYRERSILHKRGYVFFGSPGNGKTTIAMAIAEHLHRDLYLMNLNSFDGDGSMIKAFNQLGRNIILLVEDIDRAFVHRENVNSKISFSSLLNSLDGALCKDGMITAITTNFIEKLDPALIREGRIDRKFEILNPSSQQIGDYIELFYGVKLANPVYGGDYSMSYVQEYCIKNKNNPLAAINRFSRNEAKREIS